MSDHTHTPAQPHFTLRPFQNADAPRVAQLATDGVRGHWTYNPEQFRESSNPQRLRLVALHAGEVVATAHLYPFAPGTPDALRLDLAGNGAAFTPLYLHLLSHLPAGFTRLLGVTREDFTEQMQFFQAAGFRNAWQSWGAHLDLQTFDFGRYRALEEKLFLQGYEAQTLENSAPESDWDALYALYQQGVTDAPRNPTTTPDPLSRQEFQATVQREELAFVIRLKGELVASTRLTPNGQAVDSEHTVTRPGHRSRGLATLLKAHALNWAKQQGCIHAGTGGTVLNLPMLRVNTRLGYQTEQMWVTWERRLSAR